MIEMTLSSRHRIRNSSPGGLRPSTRIGPTDAVQTLKWAEALVQWSKLADCLERRSSRVRTPLRPSNLKETKYLLPAHSWWFNIVRSFRDQEVACSASDHQGSNFESCVWRVVSSHSSRHPQEILMVQFSLDVHKGGLKPHSFKRSIHSQ